MGILILILLGHLSVFANNCPGDDSEPALAHQTKAGPTLIVCGFEDHEVPQEAGRRTFSDFTIYSSVNAKSPQKVFTSEESETYGITIMPDSTLKLEELWFFDDRPKAAFQRDIVCSAKDCTISPTKCVFKMKPNPFPKALAKFEAQLKEKKFTEDSEELLDQIFAQAFTGDKKSKQFYQSEPKGLDKALHETFESNRKKIEIGCAP